MQLSHNACICSLNAVHLQKLISIGLMIAMVALLLLIWGLVDNELNTSEQFAAAAEKWCWVAPTRAPPAGREKSLCCSAQCFSGHTWNTLFSFGAHYTKGRVWAGESPQKDHRNDQTTGRLWGKPERTGFVQPSERKAWKDLITMFLHVKARITPFLGGVTWKIWEVTGTSYSWEDSNWT